MLPSVAIEYMINARYAHAIHHRQFTNRERRPTDFQNCGFREFCEGMLCAFRCASSSTPAALHDRIANVVSLRADHKMVWVAATRVVTCVHDDLSNRDLSLRKYVGDPVGKSLLLTSPSRKAMDTVAVPKQCSEPRPTTALTRRPIHPSVEQGDRFGCPELKSAFWITEGSEFPVAIWKAEEDRTTLLADAAMIHWNLPSPMVPNEENARRTRSGDGLSGCTSLAVLVGV